MFYRKADNYTTHNCPTNFKSIHAGDEISAQ